jgi:Asp/Glu/hydantoin racemase
MKKKIAVMAPMGLDLSDETIRRSAGDIFVRNAEKLKEDGTSIDFFLMNKGFINIDAFGWESLHAWNSFEFFEVVRGLKGKGYDGVVVHCYFDPYLYPLRQIMDIPVVGVVQNSLMFASLMGKKTGIVTFSKCAIPVIEDLVRKYGYEDSVLCIRSMESTMNDFMEAFFDAGPMIDKFRDVARDCISAGTEILVPG